mgnify:CR=1 FL=1
MDECRAAARAAWTEKDGSDGGCGGQRRAVGRKGGALGHRNAIGDQAHRRSGCSGRLVLALDRQWASVGKPTEFTDYLTRGSQQ